MATHWAMVDLGVNTGSVVAGQITPAVGYGGALVATSSARLVTLRGLLGYARLCQLPPSGHDRTR